MALSCALVGYDRAGKIVVWDAGAEDIFGYTSAQMLGQSIEQFIPPDERANHQQLREQPEQVNASLVQPVQRLIATGILTTGLARITPIVAPSNEIIGLLETFQPQDLADFQPPGALDIFSASLEQFIELLPYSVAVTAEDGVILVCNSALLQLTDYAASELVGQSIEFLLPSSRRSAHQEDRLEYQLDPMARWMHASQPVNITCKHERLLPVQIGLAPLTIGARQFVICTLIDLSVQMTLTQSLRVSEQRWRTLVEVASQVVWVLDLAWNMAEFSPSWSLFTGQSAEEQADLGWTQCVHPEDRLDPALICPMRDQDPQTWNREYRLRRADGAWRWMELRSAPLRDDAGTITGWIGMNTDITDRKQAEIEQRITKERYELAVSGSREGVWDWDIPSDTMYLSPAWRAHFDLPADLEFLSAQHWRDLVHPDDYGLALKHSRAYLSGTLSDYDCEFRVRYHDGSYRWIQSRGQAVFNDVGEPVRMAGSHYDVHDRHEALTALAASEARFRSVFEHATVGMVLADADTTWREPNPHLARIMGYAISDLRGQPFNAYTHPDDVAEDERMLEAAILGGHASMTREKRYLRSDGSVVWCMTNVAILRSAPDVVTGFVAIVQDINTRKLIEQRLQESEARFRQISESLPLLVWTCEPDGPCDYLSPQWVSYTGVPEELQLGFGWLAQIHPHDQEMTIAAWNAAVEQGIDLNAEFRIRRFDGAYRWFATRAVRLRNAAGDTVKWFGSNTDIHEMRELQEHLLREKQRFMKIMVTAPGVIHAFKQEVNGRFCFPFVSAKIIDIYGLLPEELDEDASPVMGIWHPADVQRLLDTIEISRRTLAPWHETFRVLHPDKGELWIEGRSMPERAADGSTLWYGFLLDITDRRRAEAALREEQDRLSAIAASAPGMIFALRLLPDETPRFEYVSPSIVDIYGYTPEEIQSGAIVEELVHPDDLQPLQMMLQQSGRSLLSWRMEYRAYHKERGLIWLECRVAPQLQTDNSVVWHGFVLDITERKQIELQAQKNAAHLALLASASEALAATRLNYRDLLDIITRLMGEAIGEPCVAALLDDSGMPGPIASIYSSDETWASLFRAIWMEGKAQASHTTLIQTVVESGLPQQAQHLSSRSEKPWYVIILNTIMRLEHLLVLPLRASDRVIGILMMCRLGSESQPFDEDDLRLAQDLADRSALAIHNSRLFWQLRQDLVVHRQTETELRQSRAQLQTALEVGAMGVWTFDLLEDRFDVDDMVLSLFKRARAELSSDGLNDLLRWVHPEDAGPVQAALQNTLDTGEASCEFRIRRPDDSIHWLYYKGRLLRDSNGHPIRTLGLVSDINERKRFDEYQLRHQKMEALGTLAGGIAHDFNNLLMAITGNARFALADLAQDTDAADCLDEILAASMRATDLVQQILTFSRPSAHDRRPIQLQPVVEEALRLVRATIPAMIVLETDWPSTLPAVAADASQVHQIIVNLATNAAHAIGARAGVISVRMERTIVSEDVAATMPDLIVGEYVRLIVSDNGSGMNQATQARIFDPFFTTKAPGEGTGLGLSVVHGIVRSHGGTITVYSQPGKGTAFHIYFPHAEGGLMSAQSVLSEITTPLGSNEHIMYVDDEQMLINLTRRVLGRMGYTLSVFTTPGEALAAFRANPQAIDLLITDVSMPEMSGFELAQYVLSLRPDLPIVMTSGYLSPEDQQRALEIGIREVVLKPHVVDQFKHLLPRLLDGSCQD